MSKPKVVLLSSDPSTSVLVEKLIKKLYADAIDVVDINVTSQEVVIDYALCFSSSEESFPSIDNLNVLHCIRHVVKNNQNNENENEHLQQQNDDMVDFLRQLPFSQLIANNDKKEAAGISFFEKYLTVWVLICMVVGAVIGYFVPSCVDGLKKAEVFNISIPIAVLLWVMIFPMLLQIDFSAVVSAVKNPGPIVMTTVVNFGIQPFTMYAVAMLFFRVFYRTIISEDMANEYLVGCILLGGAPCTAMVFVWSVLIEGNPGYTLMQVAVNDAFTLVLYLPTMLLLIRASSIPIPYDTIALSICFFIATPLVLAVIARHLILRQGGMPLLDAIVHSLKPVGIVGLLATLILIFIYQGQTIGQKPLDILLIAIPLTLQTFFIFALTFWAGYAACMEFEYLCPAALISTSNFFELAVAIAVSIYGPDSGASLATVVGVLVEVPTMLLLVSICRRLRPYLKKRCAECDEKCSGLRDFAKCKRRDFTPLPVKEAANDVIDLNM